MTDAIRLVNLGLIEAVQTQAIYHALAERMTADTPDTIVLCRPATPYLCLGYHQPLDAVLDRAACAQLGLPIVRRRVGGGATYLDANQLFYQFVFHHRRLPAMFAAVFQRLLAAPVAALQALGLPAELSQINEIEVAGQRIAGTGGARIEEAAVVVGNILFDFDFETMGAAWRAPWPSFRELAVAAMRAHITPLWQLKPDASLAAVEALLIEAFGEALKRPLQPGQLTPAELDHARRVAAQLTSAETLNLHPPRTNAPMSRLKISARAAIQAAEAELDGQTIYGSFWLRDDVIHVARLHSMPPHNWRPIEEQLRGQPWADWAQFLPAQATA